jgi:hypothetical protein
MRLLPLVALSLASLLPAQGTGIVLTNGIDAHFDVPYSPTLIPRSGITIEAWVKYDDSTIPTGTYRWPTICRQNPTPGLESYFLRVGASNTNNRSLEFKVNTVAGSRSTNYVFTAGQFANWTHLAGTWDGASLVIYVNGVAVRTLVTSGGRIADNGGVLRVGNGDVSSPGAETWNGEIDELRIWPFARSQAEIQQTMSETIGSLPGGVLSFALDNDYLDSSSGLVGTASGPIAFAPNNLVLATRAAAAFPFGGPTSTCTPAPASCIGGPAIVGGGGFAWVGVNGPANASGLLALAFGSAPSPTVVLGVAIWLDPNTLMTFGTSTNPLGACHVPLPIPNSPSLSGAGLSSQFVFLDAACGPQGLVATDGLAIGIQ